MEILFLWNDVLTIVDGTLPKPSNMDEVAQKTWLQKDKLARTYILFCISYRQLEMLHRLKTSNEMWSKLKAIYDHIDRSTKRLIKRKFSNLKLKEGESISFYLEKIYSLLDQFC